MPSSSSFRRDEVSFLEKFFKRCLTDPIRLRSLISSFGMMGYVGAVVMFEGEEGEGNGDSFCDSF